MNAISKVFASLVVGGLLVTSAVAAAPEAQYINATKANVLPGVNLYNNTWEDYTSYATYPVSGRQYNLFLGPVGTSTQSINYPTNSYDYMVCLLVVRNFDHSITYNDCITYGSVTLNYFANSGPKKNSVTATVTH